MFRNNHRIRFINDKNDLYFLYIFPTQSEEGIGLFKFIPSLIRKYNSKVGDNLNLIFIPFFVLDFILEGLNEVDDINRNYNHPVLLDVIPTFMEAMESFEFSEQYASFLEDNFDIEKFKNSQGIEAVHIDYYDWKWSEISDFSSEENINKDMKYYLENLITGKFSALLGNIFSDSNDLSTQNFMSIKPPNVPMKIGEYLYFKSTVLIRSLIFYWSLWVFIKLTELLSSRLKYSLWIILFFSKIDSTIFYIFMMTSIIEDISTTVLYKYSCGFVLR